MGPGQESHISKLTEHGLDRAAIKQSYNKLKIINSHSEVHSLYSLYTAFAGLVCHEICRILIRYLNHQLRLYISYLVLGPNMAMYRVLDSSVAQL